MRQLSLPPKASLGAFLPGAEAQPAPGFGMTGPLDDGEAKHLVFQEI